MLNKIVPHIVAFLVFLLVMGGYFKPIVFDGKTLPQGDVQQAQGMQTEIMAHHKATGHYPKWTNQMFVGMPSYQIYGAQENNLVEKIGSSIVFVGNKYNVTDPHILFFWLMVFAYIGLLLYEIPVWLALGVAISFGFMTNHSVLLEAGHCNKVFAMLYALPITGAAWQALKGRWQLGGALFAVFTALQIGASHIQITYYTFFIVGFMTLGKLIFEKDQLPAVGKAVAALGLATVLGIAANLTSLWTTYEYAQESIRGKSELVGKENNDGLSKEYIYGWSFGKMETFTLMVAHFYGGSSSESWVSDKNSATAKYLRTLPPELGNNLSGLTGKYWGAQPFTSGPVYFGAVFCFLAIFGLLLMPRSMQFAFGGAMLLFVMLSWGKHFAFFNDLMVDYFPFYNKFRAVTMTLTVAQILIAASAAWALKTVWEVYNTSDDIEKERLEQTLIRAAVVAMSIITFVLLYSLGGNLESPNVAQVIAEQQKNNPQIVPILENLESAMQEDRAALMRADALKSMLLVSLAIVLLWLLNRRRLHYILGFWGLFFITNTDLNLVNYQYLKDDKDARKSSFVNRREVFGAPEPLKADLQIKQDRDLHYRVIDFQRGSPRSSAQAAFHHKSVGGYHAAKLMLFQDVVDKYGLEPNTLQTYPQIFEMFNTKYAIVGAPNTGEPMAIPIQTALGNAWFVPNIMWVDNANAELDSLANFFPNQTAIIQKKYESYFQNFANKPAPNDKIYLTAYAPEALTYKSSAESERLAVFSEVYYPPAKGWNVYIDGKLQEAGFVKVNYLLRGLRVPAGEHTIEFKFEPRSVSTGEQVALIASLLIFASLAAALYFWWKSPKLEQ